MLVYGDPQFKTDCVSLKQRLLRKFLGLNTGSQDDLRCFLIQCGQLEQAISDQDARSEAANNAKLLTDAAAKAFCSICNQQRTIITPSFNAPEMSRELVIDQLEDLQISDGILTVKVPEGFAFYGLFPEQYYASALDWAGEHSGLSDRTVLVIGLRSIGTTLSAVVAETLNNMGWKARRITVRPAGDPSDRTCRDLVVKSCPCSILVVDEGPGLSGSSIIAVVEALRKQDYTEDQISVFPGHNHGPGCAATAQCKSLWGRIRQYYTPLTDLRWDGLTMEGNLAAKTADMLTERCEECIDLANGQWRTQFWSDPRAWPPVCKPFEKMKWLCRTSSRKAILWKFIGFGALIDPNWDSVEKAWFDLNARSKLGWSPPAKSYFNGFLAFPWLEGRALQREFDLSILLNGNFAEYLTTTAERELSHAELGESIQRLYQILVRNGFVAGVNCELKGQVLEQIPRLCLSKRSFSDDDLAPHNWIQIPNSRIAKFGGLGHNRDHTLIGVQPLEWSIAGMLVEWAMNLSQRRRLFSSLQRTSVCLDERAVDFLCAAYAAFKLGQTTISSGWEDSESPDHGRLEKAGHYYRAMMEKYLRRCNCA